jgi:hypothetical protein
MTSKTKKPRGIRVASKMPRIEFNRKAIEAIKRRKKGHYKRSLKQSKKKEVG